MTLSEFIERNEVGFQRHESGAIQVFSTSPELFNLDNYYVDGSGSGPSYWMRPKQLGFHVCRVFSPYGGERWSIGKDYDALYLNRSGEWGRTPEAATFYTLGQAWDFARQHLLNKTLATAC
jgi:hypothetical protein